MELLEYLPQVLSGWNLVILIVGTVVGLLLGATPGLSPTMAVALLIPFTFQMEATSGLILLGVLYTSTVAGGAVSAILVNIPGSPANIATMLDGHPMAKNGHASEALHYCFISSGIGGVIGVLVLVFFTPILVGVALRFGPSELFWIAILGITVIGSLGSSSVLKGLLAGAIGVWISLIGFNPIAGTERFVFSEHLQGGVTIIPALIGLFAIPQVFQMVESAKRGLGGEIFGMEHRSILTSLIYNLSKVRALGIGSLIGTVVGIIPGAGGQIAGLIAYDQAKSSTEIQMPSAKESRRESSPLKAPIVQWLVRRWFLCCRWVFQVAQLQRCYWGTFDSRFVSGARFVYATCSGSLDLHERPVGKSSSDGYLRSLYQSIQQIRYPSAETLYGSSRGYPCSTWNL